MITEFAARLFSLLLQNTHSLANVMVRLLLVRP